MMTPLNSMSNLNNYRYAYKGPGSEAEATGKTAYSTANGISYMNATYATATTPSTPVPYYGTTGATTATANVNVNVSANTVTAPAVTKTLVTVPL